MQKTLRFAQAFLSVLAERKNENQVTTEKVVRRMEDGYVATNLDSGRRIRRRTYCFDRTQIFVGCGSEHYDREPFPDPIKLLRNCTASLGDQSRRKLYPFPLISCSGSKDVNIVVDSVKEIKPNDKKVVLESGNVLSYDALVVALGSETNYFGIPGLEENSLVLKSVADANRIREHVEARLDAYKKSGSKADATIVVGGGGLTGVELVGEFADKLPEVCRSKGIDFNDISLYCVEAGPAVLPIFPKVLIERAVESLSKRGVTFITGVAITEATKTSVSLKDGNVIESSTIIWTGGVKGNPVVGSSGLAEDRGRSTVTQTLQSTSHADVFLAGDCAVVFPGRRRTSLSANGSACLADGRDGSIQPVCYGQGRRYG